MEILSINAEEQLCRIASSIGRDPQSWVGWACVAISLEHVDKSTRAECLLWVKSIADAYLSKAQGRIYFCNDIDIHILCKDLSMDILEQAAMQICDLVHVESGGYADYGIYCLGEDGYEYASMVLSRISRRPVSMDFKSATTRALKGGEIAGMLPGIAEPHNLEAQTLAKVMLVEDDPVTRWMVRNALKNECRFATAPTANKAFSMFTSFRPDIVFLDINLPDKSGYEVLEWIKRNDPGACVIMFSGNNNLDNISNALADGASGFISKPFLKENLLHYISANANIRGSHAR